MVNFSVLLRLEIRSKGEKKLGLLPLMFSLVALIEKLIGRWNCGVLIVLVWLDFGKIRFGS